MEGVIKKILGIFPVTVIDAVYVGNGSPTTLRTYIKNRIAETVPKKMRKLSFNFTPYIDAIDSSVSYEEASEIHASTGVLQYVGGLCANNKIYCCPNSSDNILVYDTEKDTVYHIGQGLGTNQFKWTGLVCHNGFIYTIPRGGNSMLRIDPVTDEVTVIDLETTFNVNPYGDYRDSHHYNGAISDEGYLYCPPTYMNNPTSDKLWKINMTTFASEFIDFPVGCSGCTRHPTENKIIFIADNKLILWDCTDDTYEEIDTEITGSADMLYDPRYPGYMIGIYKDGGYAFNLTDHSISTINLPYNSTGYGITLGLDGKYWHFDNGKCLWFTFDGTKLEACPMGRYPTYTCSGASPAVAGQAIDNDGNIYGIPASGGLVKLTATGVTKKLPDYIVSSQHYGKF